jgi:hypothetical protein
MSWRAVGPARKLRRHELRETESIPPEPCRLVERVGPEFESRHAVEDVIGPARFAVFTVVHDVEAGVELLSHHLRRGLLQRLLVARLLRWLLSGCGGLLEERFRADQAADMGRQDAIGAASHQIR